MAVGRALMATFLEVVPVQPLAVALRVTTTFPTGRVAGSKVAAAAPLTVAPAGKATGLLFLQYESAKNARLGVGVGITVKVTWSVLIQPVAFTPVTV